ncbi:MAG: response regulator [Ignavibacteriaceae bacterium]
MLNEILYVEDEDIAFDVVRRFLVKHSNIYRAVNADSVIEILGNKKIDIILMDISLKHSINGIDLTRLIRTMPEYIHIPIIAVTAHAMAGDKEKILESGCDAYLSKPFSRQELINIINLHSKV